MRKGGSHSPASPERPEEVDEEDARATEDRGDAALILKRRWSTGGGGEAESVVCRWAIIGLGAWVGPQLGPAGPSRQIHDWQSQAIRDS